MPLELRTLADAKKKKKETESAPPAGEPAAERDGPAGTRGARTAPMSFAQERLWFLDRLDPGNPRFNISSAVRLSGRLVRPALARALDAIVRRHEIYRTRFPADDDGRPFQRILLHRPHPLPVVDLGRLAPEVRRAHLHRLLEREAKRPFDLARGPLVRTPLFRLADEEHVLVLDLHQIVVDRWSRGLFVQELATGYAAFRAGRTPALPEPAIQYADYAVRQREELRGDRLERLVAWWRGRLDGFPRAFELPLDRPRPRLQRGAGETFYRVLPEELAVRLDAVAERRGATPFMALLAAYAVLLHQAAGGEPARLIVGSPIANRNRRQVEGLMGFLVNLLALPVSLEGDPSFGQLVERVRETALGAYEHQDLPFERLVESLELERDPSRHPLFQTTLTLQNAPMPPLDLPELEARLIEIEWRTTAFDLAFFFWRTAAWESLDPGLSLTVVYDRDLFDRTTVERFARRFEEVVRAVGEAPERPISTLSGTTAAERHQLLREWPGSSTGERSAADPPIDRMVAARAAADPRAPAITAGGVTTSYGELLGSSRRVAGELRRRGIGPESVVAVAVGRSAELTALLLGVLCAGGAYLPLDPSQPPARLARLVGAAGARLLVAPPGLLGEEPPCPVADPAVLLAGGPSGEPAGEADLAGRDGGETLAAVLYTSGSTGAPKAVALPHRALAQLVRAGVPGGMGSSGVLGPGRRVAHAADPAFDAASFELWVTLAHGAEVVVLEPETVLSPTALAEAIERQRLDVLFLTTALFHRLIDEVPAALARPVRLLVGGESLHPATTERYHAAGGSGLIHVYGPTEATTFATADRVSPGDADRRDGASDRRSRVPIGRPLEGARAVVADPRLRPAPVGAPGELLLGGPRLARGYLRHPAETAARFVPDPFSGELGARLYRTGDQVRSLADGRLEFLGRRDRQLKVRGVRIEPAEVEAALAAHPAVAEAVVGLASPAGTPDDPAAAALTAWVAGTAPLPEELVAHLGRLLPRSMVPTELVVLPELPKTAGGKLDRRRLPRPERTVSASGGEAPRGPLEETIAELWSEVLGRPVGRHDDFFTSGGHSLHATTLVARLERRLGRRVPVRDLFELRTPAACAAAWGDADSRPSG